MANKKKKKSVSKKRKSELTKRIKKFPRTKKALIKTLMYGAAPALFGYQGLKGKKEEVDWGKLGETLDLTDPDVRSMWGDIIKEKAGEAKEEYFGKDSGWEGKGQLAADVLGTIWDFSPYSLPFDSDFGFGSKPAGAGSTLDNYSPKQLEELRRKAMGPRDLTPSQLKQLKGTMYGEENFKNLERKLAIPRKKGGKVIKSKTKKNKKSGRPKGVGCATRGYGKAMKRGK